MPSLPYRTTRRLFVAALLIVALWFAVQPAEAANRPKPCIGAIVRSDIPGVAMVRRSDGTICSRPAAGTPIAPKRGK